MAVLLWSHRCPYLTHNPTSPIHPTITHKRRGHPHHIPTSHIRNTLRPTRVSTSTLNRRLVGIRTLLSHHRRAPTRTIPNQHQQTDLSITLLLLNQVGLRRPIPASFNQPLPSPHLSITA